MYANNTTTNREESISDILVSVSLYYGFTWYPTKVGILINHGAEYWLIKLNINGRTVRKLLHQNHGRTGTVKPASLACNAEAFNNTIIQQYFHNQKFAETDLRRTLQYIYHHGNARRNIELERNILIQAAFA